MKKEFKIVSSFKRYEKKYMITPEQQKKIIEASKKYMESDEYGSYTICNIYYDTEDWKLIRASIEKPVYKEKLRVRSYGVPEDKDKVFVEIKKKYDGIVYKRRIDIEANIVADYLDFKSDFVFGSQIGREIEWFQKFYQAVPKVFIGYDRTAFKGIEDSELRITFDSNLRWRDTDLDLRYGDYGSEIIPKDNVLMEIKVNGTAPMWLSRLLSEVKAFPSSFSKYGTCYKKFLINVNNDEEVEYNA